LRSIEPFSKPRDRGTLKSYACFGTEASIEGKAGPEALAAAAQGHEIDDEKANRTVRFLLDLGVDVNARDSDGYAPLQKAALGDKLLVAQTLLDSGADINATCDCKKAHQAHTPLMIATIYEHKDLFKLLLAKGADVNKRNADDGRTALMFATYRDEATVRALLERGARIDDRDNDDKTALDIAEGEFKIGRIRPGLIRALKEAGAK
jgi:ankyrin repeat protein